MINIAGKPTIASGIQHMSAIRPMMNGMGNRMQAQHPAQKPPRPIEPTHATVKNTGGPNTTRRGYRMIRPITLSTKRMAFQQLPLLFASPNYEAPHPIPGAK